MTLYDAISSFQVDAVAKVESALRGFEMLRAANAGIAAEAAQGVAQAADDGDVDVVSGPRERH